MKKCKAIKVTTNKGRMTKEMWNPMQELAEKERTDKLWPPYKWMVWSKQKVGGQKIYAEIMNIPDSSTVDPSAGEVIKVINECLKKGTYTDHGETFMNYI